VSTRVLEAGLEAAQWDMVHFIGHSYCGKGNDTRTVIFVAGETSPVPVDVEVLALLLRDAKTRFVYLSSCSSAAFALQLALKQVSSIVGYHWEVNDDAARIHTERFYTNLFTEFRSLDLAFLQTRKDMSRKREDRTWAASVLVDQVEE
jgi:CHAT domain-containing protein